MMLSYLETLLKFKRNAWMKLAEQPDWKVAALIRADTYNDIIQEIHRIELKTSEPDKSGLTNEC